MNLHEDKDAFLEICAATAQHIGIRSIYVEKDYWVTKSLSRIHSSNYADKVVFKGGTSLSKAYKLINRFSEDIDLAIKCDDLSGNQIKNLLKKVTEVATVDLKQMPKHPLESKGSKFRKTVHSYPRDLEDNADFGEVTEGIVIEINSFTQPEPASTLAINTLIAEHLATIDRNDLIDKFNLHPFDFAVLDVERTLTEKVMALIKTSYAPQPEQEWIKKIRHFYDIAMILRNDRYRKFVESDELFKMLNIVKADDIVSFGESASAWTSPPLGGALLFQKVDSSWAAIERAFKGDFALLVYDNDIPSTEEMLTVLHLLAERVSAFEDHTP